MSKKSAKKTAKKVTEKPAKKQGNQEEMANKCPRCGHFSGSKAVKLGSPNRQYFKGEHDGRRFSLIERQRIACENCGQLHFVRQYK